MTNPCEKCGGRCCIGLIDVYSTDEIFYDDDLTCEIEGMKYDKVMRTGDDLRCIAQKDGWCTIYEKRPQVCRAFEVGNPCCLNFQAGKLNAHTCNICSVSEALTKTLNQIKL